jgi:hypothetical protein
MGVVVTTVSLGQVVATSVSGALRLVVNSDALNHLLK